MRRRRLLGLLGVGLGLGTAGCASETGTPPSETATDTLTGQSPRADTPTRTAPPEYDCSEASRPTLASADARTDDAIELRSYPEGPPRIDDESAVVEYVKQYERAFVQKSVRRDLDDPIAEFGFGIHDVWTYVAPDGAAVVRLEYNYFATLSSEGEASGGHLDSGIYYVSYYLDGDVVIRAEVDGIRDPGDALVPDPWESGAPVECFE